MATLTPFEIATGIVFGTVDLPEDPAPRLPSRAALERVIRPALTRTPCMVAFSGGRDSSALLALTVSLARREGLPEPIALTLDFEGSATGEREWQELVVGHVGVSDWVRVAVEGELDLIGNVAAGGLRRHGVLYPANAHVVVPLARQAAGGALLTGLGGDDVFGRWPWNDVASLLAGRRRVRRADPGRCLHAIAPAGLRAEALVRASGLSLPWLQPAVRPAAARRLARELGTEPRTWRARERWAARWRPWRTTVDSIALLGAEHGATVISPFLDPAVLDALGRDGGLWGWGNRTETMRALFSDLLPEQIIDRKAKAEFSEPLFGRETKRFAREWDGRSGIDETLVDGNVLRQVWTAPQPHFLSALAVQSAWLASTDR